jgi:DNA-binding MarR family transcriptional regulator
VRDVGRGGVAGAGGGRDGSSGLACAVLLEACGAEGAADGGTAVHRVTWDAKRVFLRLVRVRRHLMDRWGLTPARFDMLFAIRCQRQRWFPQRKLRELLGVCASTISRMLDSLVALGFMRKRQVEGDRRRRELAITDHGKRTLRCMFTNIIKSGLARRVVGHLLADDPDGAPTTDEEITRVLRAFETTLGYFKMNLEDTACFDYGSGGECAQPPPLEEISDPSDYDRTYWLGDVEPALDWIKRT